MVESQIIASVQNESALNEVLNSNSNIVFLLTGNLITTPIYIKKLKKAGKYTFIHLDFIEGLSSSKSAIDYIASDWKPTGIITTKSHLVKYANEVGLLTIQRIFLLDKSAIEKGIEMVKSCRPTAVEIMPGIIPKVIDQLSLKLKYPIIAGGLVTETSEVHEALKYGALAVSSGNPQMWKLDL